MKVKFLNSIELEITSFNGSPNSAIYKAGQTIEVHSVEVNEEFETAAIVINENSIIYGVPLNAFEVVIP